VKVGFADERHGLYQGYLNGYALELFKHMTIKDVVAYLGVSWDVIKDIQNCNLHRRFAKPKIRKLKRNAIDEISIGKDHRYLTIVPDLSTGAVVFMGDSKGSDALEPFGERLKCGKARKIKAVAIDMSPAYISAVIENLPDASIVFDHFHIIKLFNDKLSDLRRKLFREATDFLKKTYSRARDGCFLRVRRTWTMNRVRVPSCKMPSS